MSLLKISSVWSEPPHVNMELVNKSGCLCSDVFTELISITQYFRKLSFHFNFQFISGPVWGNNQ